jgi:uncharacterized NAD(P)/FAD-binding protein YdhS
MRRKTCSFVLAGRMGAFSEDPEHFLKWLRDRGRRVDPWDFLPRTLYRDYPLAVMREALETGVGSATLEHVRGEVHDVALEDGGVTIHLDTRVFAFDRAVLALGNFPPRHPKSESRSSVQSRRYVHDPWQAGAVQGL